MMGFAGLNPSYDFTAISILGGPRWHSTCAAFRIAHFLKQISDKLERLPDPVQGGTARISSPRLKRAHSGTAPGSAGQSIS